jgi:cell fate regulator YaaT (PSP1 superfamily)
MKKNNVQPDKVEIRRVYRKAKETDLEKYQEAKAKEQGTMIKARQIAESLKLNMKIGDVEYQGDGNKAIFYYIADERVDFRQLIKVFAESFRVRIEMKQIGARQEAGRIGGIGPCGRELCCSGWMTNFNSVSTSAARYQDISLNPQKLAGQCAKLKCCMNFELDSYMDALKEFPSKEIQLETLDNTFYHFKTDVFKGMISYSTSQNFGANIVIISAKRSKEVIAMNKKGIKPDLLDDQLEEDTKPVPVDYENVVGQDSLTRFDTKKKRPAGKNNRHEKIAKPVLNEDKENGNKQRFEKPIKRNDIGTEKNEK